MSKKVLITGAGGLIGYELVNLLKQHHIIWTLGRTEAFPNEPNVRHINLDLSSDWSDSILPEVDIIYHLAQSEHFREFPDKAQDVFLVNTHSTMKLLNYARRVQAKKFVYASSGGIYGYGDTGFSEDHEIKTQGDLGFYIGTKLCSEILVENYAGVLDVDIIRFFFAYGPRQRKSMLIPRLIENIQQGKTITLQGTGGIKINPVFVLDAAKAIAGCLDLQGSHKINIAGSEIITIRELSNLIGELTGHSPVFDIKSQEQARHLFADITKMERLLSAPRISLEEGIKKMLLPKGQ